jgi:hypothetical protein
MSNYSTAFDRLLREAGRGSRWSTPVAEPPIAQPPIAERAAENVAEDAAETAGSTAAEHDAELPSTRDGEPAPVPRAAEPIPEPLRLEPSSVPESAAVIDAAPPRRNWLGVAGIRTHQQREAYSSLLDSIRTIPQLGGRAPFVVIGGASRAEAVDRVIGGLVDAGSQRGIRVVGLELAATSDGRELRAHPACLRGGSDLRPFDAGTPNIAAELDKWLRSALGRYDVVVIAAPALSDSADGALLGRTLDGLFVVAEQGRTRNDDLRVAAQRARSACATVHGLVLTESRSWLPAWLARVLGGDPA